MDLRGMLGRGQLRTAGDDVDLLPQYEMEKMDAKMMNPDVPFPEYKVWKQMKLQQPKPASVVMK